MCIYDSYQMKKNDSSETQKKKRFFLAKSTTSEMKIRFDIIHLDGIYGKILNVAELNNNSTFRSFLYVSFTLRFRIFFHFFFRSGNLMMKIWFSHFLRIAYLLDFLCDMNMYDVVISFAFSIRRTITWWPIQNWMNSIWYAFAASEAIEQSNDQESGVKDGQLNGTTHIKYIWILGRPPF